MKKKGISLIVLVITIIVMIIIAGAVIISLTETNIIDQAQSAVGKHNDTELKQRITLTFAETQANRYSEEIVANNLKVLFEEVYGKDNVTVVKSGNNYKVKLKDSNEVLKVKTDGTIEEYKEMAPTPVYAKLDDEGVLYLRATEKEGYRLYNQSSYIQSDWNTAGDATSASVIKVIIEGEIAPTKTRSMFALSNLIEIENLENLHTENVTDMSYMFQGCKIEELDLSHFDTINVTNMNQMFGSCKSLINLDISSFDTRNTTNMNGIFHGCSSLTELDISNFDTSNATTIRQMFSFCSSLRELKLGELYVVKDNTNTENIFMSASTDVKITATKETRDKLISASSLTEANFEIIESVEN